MYNTLITTNSKNILFIFSEKYPLYLAPINRLKAGNHSGVAAGIIKDLQVTNHRIEAGMQKQVNLVDMGKAKKISH